MTNPTFRALCAELSFIWGRSTNPDDLFENMLPLVNRARTALAQTEPVAPTDEELLMLAEDAWIPFAKSQPHPQGHSWDLVLARAVLARWGRPANAINQEDYDRG